MRRLFSLSLMVALVAVTSPLSAQVTTYTSLSAWLAAVSGAAVDTYDDMVPALMPSPLTRVAPPYSYRASAEDGFFSVGMDNDRWLSTNEPLTPIVFDTFTPAITAFGGNFFLTDLGGAPIIGGEVRIEWTTVGSTGFAIRPATLGSFFGVVSATPISIFSVAPVQSANGGDTFATVNDLRLAMTTVPEPATYALLGAGLSLLAVFRSYAARRRTVA